MKIRSIAISIYFIFTSSSLFCSSLRYVIQKSSLRNLSSSSKNTNNFKPIDTLQSKIDEILRLNPKNIYMLAAQDALHNKKNPIKAETFIKCHHINELCKTLKKLQKKK